MLVPNISSPLDLPRSNRQTRDPAVPPESKTSIDGLYAVCNMVHGDPGPLRPPGLDQCRCCPYLLCPLLLLVMHCRLIAWAHFLTRLSRGVATAQFFSTSLQSASSVSYVPR